MNVRWVKLLLFLLPMLACGCDSSTRHNQIGSTSPPSVSNDKVSSSPESSKQKTLDRDSEIDSAEALTRTGRHAEAAAVLRRILLTDPGDAEVLFRLARIQAAMGDLREAVEILESIPESHPDAGLPALGQGADWCMELQRYDDAEMRYRKVIAKAPNVAYAHRQLAFLYNRQGRRHEAADHIRVLCRLGDVRQDELHALMIVTDAIFEDPRESPDSGNGRRYLPIGPAATARMLYTAKRYEEARDTLHESMVAGSLPPSLVAFYGRLATEAQDEQRFMWWLARSNDSVKEFSEYWAAVGTFLLGKQRYEEAVRALAEALRRDPTDLLSIRRINQALMALGKIEEADRWMDRFALTRQITLASNEIGESDTPDLESFATITEGLEKLHRPLEAVTWRLFEAFHRKASRDEITKLNEQRSALFRSEEAFPSQSDRLCGLALTDYPLPRIDIPELYVTSLPPERGADITSFDPPRFENIASKVGLDHTYQVASQDQPYRFALYQSLGGGVAVLDYNLDGLVDLYLAQGGSDPPEMIGEMSNLFYQSVGDRFVDVSSRTGTADRRYSVGVTAGDWNQDGFSDLVVANIGNKVLMINNGDGTFRRREFDVDPSNEVLTSSVAMGDVSGDALPDIFSLHYVEDRSMLTRPEVNEEGNVEIISPLSFDPGTDRIAINDGSGGLASQMISESKSAPSTGLGVVIADWDGKPGNEIFVGNDIRPNHLWARGQPADQWVDIAALTGCAHGHGGASTASMGIAVADFDGTGTMDIHITNFYLEPVSLFINRGGTFEDRCIQYKLYNDSSSVLGFGCQAVDYNIDGRPDLAVSNGHIEKSPGDAFHHPPQFFVNLGREFRLAEVDDPSGYWSGKYLGRGMARLDFNRDGKSDLVITHMGSPSALLLNQTETENHWLNFQLVGTECERDAIGAQVTVHAGEEVWTNWIVGGDGYLCRNEATVAFGLGRVTSVDRVVVRWPNGNEQTFEHVAVDQRMLLIENDLEAFTQIDWSAPRK